MGKKRKIRANPQKFRAKHSTHPALKSVDVVTEQVTVTEKVVPKPPSKAKIVVSSVVENDKKVSKKKTTNTK